MKCTNKSKLNIVILCILSVTVLMYGCGKQEYPAPYGYLSTNENYSIDYSMSTKEVALFASDLCATNVDIVDTSDVDRSTFLSALSLIHI